MKTLRQLRADRDYAFKIVYRDFREYSRSLEAAAEAERKYQDALKEKGTRRLRITNNVPKASERENL